MTDFTEPDTPLVLTLQVWPGLALPSRRTVSVHDAEGRYVSSYDADRFPLAEAAATAVVAAAEAEGGRA